MNAPLLYRLTGDTYYLHVDPEFAGKFGFQRPIVHGLCSLGYACRMLIGMFFPGEPERMVSLENQFRNVAMPGDSFRVQAWKTGGCPGRLPNGRCPGQSYFGLRPDHLEIVCPNS